MSIAALRHFELFWFIQHLITDNGSHLTNDEFRQFLKENNIFDTLTGPRHPTTNGLAEQYVGEFKDKLGGNTPGKTL